jgi:hypothetical protein
MKTIQKEELYQNLKGFLKGKGIELQEGSYTHRIEQGCGVLADSINVSQKALHAAKEEMGKRLEQVRQVIHEKTAPKAPPVQTATESTVASAAPKAAAKKRAPKAKKARAGGRRKK